MIANRLTINGLVYCNLFDKGCSTSLMKILLELLEARVHLPEVTPTVFVSNQNVYRRTLRNVLQQNLSQVPSNYMIKSHHNYKLILKII